MCTCLLDEDTKASLRISQAIDRELSQFKKENAREFKLLLLGTGEAGKSTFIKQMRIIHGQGYSDKDRAEFKTLVYRNTVKGIQIMIEAMETLKIPYTDPSKKSHIPVLERLDPDTVTEMSQEEFAAIRSLWADPGMKKCFDQRNQFQISDSVRHYFDNLDRLSTPDYVPSLDDVLRVRVPTTGIVEYNFQMKKEVVFKMVDVGGQRSERRKWIHCFEGVKAIIFLTAINEYDQVSCNIILNTRVKRIHI
jgi:GTPase SAR1 family protein